MRYSPIIMGAAALILGGAFFATSSSDAAYTESGATSVAAHTGTAAIQLARANDYDCTNYQCRKKPRVEKPKPKKGSGRRHRLIPDGRGGWCYRMRSGGYYCPDG